MHSISPRQRTQQYPKEYYDKLFQSTLQFRDDPKPSERHPELIKTRAGRARRGARCIKSMENGRQKSPIESDISKLLRGEPSPSGFMLAVAARIEGYTLIAPGVFVFGELNPASRARVAAENKRKRRGKDNYSHFCPLAADSGRSEDVGAAGGTGTGFLHSYVRPRCVSPRNGRPGKRAFRENGSSSIKSPLSLFQRMCSADRVYIARGLRPRSAPSLPHSVRLSRAQGNLS